MNMPIALALLLVGILLLLVGLNAGDPIASAFSRLFSGKFSDRTTWLIVVGCICAIAGLVGCYRSRRI